METPRFSQIQKMRIQKKKKFFFKVAWTDSADEYFMR